MLSTIFSWVPTNSWRESNGVTTNPVYLRRGLRQGCSLWPSELVPEEVEPNRTCASGKLSQREVEPEGTGARGKLSQRELEPEGSWASGNWSQREVEPDGTWARGSWAYWEVEPEGSWANWEVEPARWKGHGNIFFFNRHIINTTKTTIHQQSQLNKGDHPCKM